LADLDRREEIHMSESRGPAELPARRFRFWFVVIAFAVIVLFVALTIVRLISPTAIVNLNTDVMEKHWPAVFGIPLIGLLALFVVLLTTTVTGEIKFELGPIKVSGAAGESIVWLIGFFLGVWAFKELWLLPP